MSYTKFYLTKRMLAALAVTALAMGVFWLAERLFGSAGFLVAIVALLIGLPIALDLWIARADK